MNKKHTPSTDFKGFDDFIKLFESGTRTDSAGRTAAWTNDDIDQIIANHSAADAAPIVIGHPAPDASSFAYGWVDPLKRQGGKLLGTFKQVDPGFEQLVKDGKLKNRSIRIVKGATGLRLGHVGWLGATPPAIAGLKPVEFASADEVFDFSEADWRPTSIMARMMRNLRELFIEKYGQEQTDKVLSNVDIDELNRLSEQQYQAEQAEQADDAGLLSSFSLKDPTMTITQADLDAAQRQTDELNQKNADFAAQNQTLQQQLDAERQIDGYLRSVYPLPLPAEVIAASSLPEICGDIVRSVLFKGIENEQVRQAYKDAIAWLKDVQAKRVTLGAMDQAVVETGTVKLAQGQSGINWSNY